jgi:hypothetical protein
MPGKPGMKGENLGGSRPGAGRKAVWFKAQRGEGFVAERETIGGEICKPELWTVLSVSVDEIEFQCGDDIIVIRKPESDD